jgi:Ca-activated chloride channel homolog
MRCRSILKWIGLTALSLTIVFLLFTITHDDIASAATQKARPQTQGSLEAFNEEGQSTGECPLKHTEVKAQVSGFISRVTVTQEFENNFTEKIEALYTFPLPEAAAVDDLTMQIGERVIKGKIMRREEAKAAYTAAKEIGKVASLLDQEQPNIFTQQVANIMPGQSIRIVISYVETLKYENGSYEWSFPMVVGPRYNPARVEQDDTSQISPQPSAAATVRAGHDISLEIDLDAGMPIVAVNSDTHETEVQKINEKHAVVRLRDNATIPNKDFVLTYRVAGDTINDAVLAHRSERGGFFTLILQPPQRVTAEDVMPKELVFVLDTSGSMSGFPIETAKQTLNLALNNLYPHDTFNVITFSGDTEILFPEPVRATPANLQKARVFLESQQGSGGTEMMKAVKAALQPSDSQAHIRITCFMTDGQVGNDAEILAEVQKYKNARVFAMGFGSTPNRYLLDNMTTYGRGEVDYVTDVGETSKLAQRYNERVRSPLLTDISIDWSDLPVSDVYPKRIPDLFGVKPLILSGRYSKAAKGTIHLRGKLPGQDFVRDIPVELPESEADHDVLASLWGRRRIDDLTRETLDNSLSQTVLSEKKEEIAKVGLDYKLMTQYTSFVAIDDVIFTGAETPKKVEIAADSAVKMNQLSYLTPGTVSATETVTSAPMLESQNALLGNTFTTTQITELPLNGRNVTGLLTLSPGAAPAKPPVDTYQYQANVSVNGQRPGSNSFTIDGINANFGIAPGGKAPGASAAGNVGNDALDANDWFANSRGLKPPLRRLNIFGGTFGGPIKRDKIFFLRAYEGMRFLQPMVDTPAELHPCLNAFPFSTGGARAAGFPEFASSFANPAKHDVGSIRIDQSLTNMLTLTFRYLFANSNATQGEPAGFSLNTTNRIHSRSQMMSSCGGPRALRLSLKLLF